MKRLIPNALLLLCVLFAAKANAQSKSGNKPALFSNFSAVINCPKAELNKAFALAANQNINLSFSDNFLFSGTITSNVVKYANLQTVQIKSAAFGDVTFVLSKITDADKSIRYVGRIINPKYADGYELKKDAFNNYQLIKISTGTILQDCHQN
jgi:hypothetical protein